MAFHRFCSFINFDGKLGASHTEYGGRSSYLHRIRGALCDLPEMIAKVPCCTSVTKSPSWVVGLKRNCLSSIRLFDPAEKRVLSMKVIPTLPLGPVVNTSACSSRSPVLAGCCTLFRTSETCPATFLIWPI